MKPVVRPPSAESQLAFLGKLQRLFAEGDFTATYKFALLTALADLAVAHGSDDGAALTLSNRQIAECFVSLYWQHAMPYGAGRSGSTPGVLLQNLGEQAVVVKAISEFRNRTGAHSLVQARAVPEFMVLVAKVAGTVSSQPLKYLQNFGGGTDAFIYEREGRGSIRLLPGVTYCLRRFYPLIQQLSRAEWIAHIKGNQRNHGILGQSDDLEDFLFSTSRQSLDAMGAGLRKLDGDRCFYCGGKLGKADVDHFIPFSLYPRDLAHNFLLAHPACNRSKSDALAARSHLERWVQRLETLSGDITQIGRDAGIPADINLTSHVGQWAYESAATSAARAWIAPRKFELVDASHLNLLRDAVIRSTVKSTEPPGVHLAE